MKVTQYEFGRICLDGKPYCSDVLVTRGKVYDSWWRKKGHELQVPDLQEILDAAPEVLVVGTGYYGRLSIPEETKRFLHSKGIRLLAAPTREAVQELNKLVDEGENAAGAFHLTC